MADVAFYRDEKLPFLELKRCRADEITYHKHYHEEYSIGLIRTGATNAWCDGTKLTVEAGRVIGFPPGMLHACDPVANTDWHYEMLYIDPQWLSGLAHTELDRLYASYLMGEEKNAACRRYMLHTVEAVKEKREPLEVETALIRLIHAAISNGSDDCRHNHSRGSDHKYVKLLKSYMHDHYREQVTLDELERVAGIGKFHLVRLFKQWNDIPLQAYQNLIRINRAKVELAKKRPIAEVAAEMGYYDQSHFTKMFTRIVGATPGKYALSVR